MISIQAASSPSVASLAGNAIALVVLVWKTLYDLWWNNRRFEKEKVEANNDLQKLRTAVDNKQHRARVTTMITFGVLAISYLVFILGEWYDV